MAIANWLHRPQLIEQTLHALVGETGLARPEMFDTVSMEMRKHIESDPGMYIIWGKSHDIV
jgi:hypothetical protein